MKKLLSLLMLIILMTGCGGENISEDIYSMKHSHTLVVGIDEFAPFSFTDESGQVVGFDVDLARETAKHMGVELEFRMINWSDKEHEITSDNIDMIWNGLDIMDEYKKFMIFSKPYMDNRQIIMVKKDNPQEIHSVGDLEGKNVAAQAGSNAEFLVKEDAYLKDSLKNFYTYPTIGESFAGLDTGDVDALIIDEIAARYEISKHPDMFETVEVTIGSGTEYGVGFRKNNTELRDKVQTAFDAIVRDGTAKKISEKWFQADLIKLRR